MGNHPSPTEFHQSCRAWSHSLNQGCCHPRRRTRDGFSRQILRDSGSPVRTTTSRRGQHGVSYWRNIFDDRRLPASGSRVDIHPGDPVWRLWGRDCRWRPSRGNPGCGWRLLSPHGRWSVLARPYRLTPPSGCGIRLSSAPTKTRSGPL